MEKFSGKEKAALVIFGLILLAIILQIVVQGDIFSLQPAGITPGEWEEADLSGDLIRRTGAALTASSHNEANQTPDRLADDDPRSFWHLDLERVGEPAWITADFGPGEKRIVRGLAALPREDIPRQFLRNSRLLGSDDGETWETIAALALWEIPRESTWRRWEFENDRAFRYYRLLITDGHEGGRFYSMAGLALFEE